MMDRIQYWINIAEYDLETAKTMLEGKRFLYVGFMCHQTIEKILKAYFYFMKNENAPYTHNLRFLATESRIFEKMSFEQQQFVISLEPLNIEARYPEYKQEIFKKLNYEICENIVIKTRELYKWIKKQLSSE